MPMSTRSAHLMRLVCVLLLLAGCFSGRPSRPSTVRGYPNGTSDPSRAMKLSGVSTDPTYGFTKANPIKVGGAPDRTGSRNEQMYLHALRGPEGQPIRFERTGSCCQFETPNGIGGGGMLDIYEVAYEGLKRPLELYINMYDHEAPKAPVGFTHY